MAFGNNKSPTTPPAPSDDLSQRIAQTLGCKPGEIIRCTRVGVTHYRVNWWTADDTNTYDNPSMRGSQIGTTHRICRSEYVDAVADGTEVRIRVVQNRN